MQNSQANTKKIFTKFFWTAGKVSKRELTEFFAELTESAPRLSEAQWVLFSETVLSKQYSARFLNMHSQGHSKDASPTKTSDPASLDAQFFWSQKLASIFVISTLKGKSG